MEAVVGPQFLKTASGEELVVLSRHDYDALLARLGDEAAEDRLLGAMAEQTRRNIALGQDFLLPAWLTDGLLARRNPVLVVREHFDQSLDRMAQAAGIPAEQLRGIEGGSEMPSTEALDAISTSVGLDPRILRSVQETAAGDA